MSGLAADHPGRDRTRWLAHAWPVGRNDNFAAKNYRACNTLDEAWSFVITQSRSLPYGASFSISTPVRDGNEFRHQLVGGELHYKSEPAPVVALGEEQ